MRPGFYTRKSGLPHRAERRLAPASMRPGFYTRKSTEGLDAMGISIDASMRPGFYTRKSWIRRAEHRKLPLLQ